MATPGVPPVPATAESTNSPFNPPPDWIAVIVLVGSMLVVAAIIVVIRVFILRSPEIIPTRQIDLESTSTRRADPQLDSLVISALDSVAPARSYSKLESDRTLAEIPPDQSGPSVECVICLEIFKKDSMVRCLGCHHIFHAECIDKWLLKHHTTCPLCLACYIPESSLPKEPPRVLPYPEFHTGPRVLGEPEGRAREFVDQVTQRFWP